MHCKVINLAASGGELDPQNLLNFKALTATPNSPLNLSVIDLADEDGNPLMLSGTPQGAAATVNISPVKTPEPNTAIPNSNGNTEHKICNNVVQSRNLKAISDIVLRFLDLTVSSQILCSVLPFEFGIAAPPDSHFHSAGARTMVDLVDVDGR